MYKNTSFKTMTLNNYVEDAIHNIKSHEHPNRGAVAAKRFHKKQGTKILRRQFKALETEEPETISHRLVLRDETGREVKLSSAHWTGKRLVLNHA